jgi:hypothetical protein
VEAFLININMPTESSAYFDCKNNLLYMSKMPWLAQPKNYRAEKRNDRGLHASAISPPQGLYYYSFFVAYFETPSVSQIYVGSKACHKIHLKNTELIIIIIIFTLK